jgi:hypothetical protein
MPGRTCQWGDNAGEPRRDRSRRAGVSWCRDSGAASAQNLQRMFDYFTTKGSSGLTWR